MSLEFVPIAIRSLMAADVAVTNELGQGDALRVYPVEAPEHAVYPYVVYHQMEERFANSKEQISIPDGWELMVTIHAKDPGAYMFANRIARLTRRAIDYQTSEVIDDDGEAFTVRLKQTGQEDITPEDEKNIISIALTFRGTKIS